MARECCGGGAKTQQASVAAPYDATMPDGTVVRVKNKAEERVERDKVWAKQRAQARKDGYRISR